MCQLPRRIADLIRHPATGGILVTGGNMANFVAFLAARRAQLSGAVRTAELAGEGRASGWTSRRPPAPEARRPQTCST
jgi:glutamate/tyrosine decarboxylase-like PLP-dependent enzyme